MKSVIISEAAPEDAEALLALQREAFQTEARLYDDWSIAPLTQTLDELRENFENRLILKAVSGQELLGSVRARPFGSSIKIERLIVAPAARRQGLATILMRAIESDFPEAESFELFTGSRSEGNIRFYQRLGYDIAREEVVSPKVTLVFMPKKVHPA